MTHGNLKQYREGVLLEEGEENRPHRVRAVTEVHQWLASMSASERGQLLTALYHARAAAPDVTSEKISKQENARPAQPAPDVTPDVTSETNDMSSVSKLKRKARTTDGQPRANLEQLRARFSGASDLSGLVEVLLSPVPNRSRLSPAQLQLIETVEAGAKLYREGAAGGYVLVMEGQRREQHAGPVNALRKLGIVR